MRVLILASLLLVFLSGGAAADPRALCAATEAIWTYGETPLARQAAPVALPDGAATHAWECQVGAHTLTVRSAREPRAQQGRCGACDLGWVTVWIDRRAIAPQEPVGDWDLDLPHPEQVLRSVTLKSDEISICRERFDEADEPVPTCTVIPFTDLRSQPRDRTFVPVARRERFRWRLWEGSERRCATLTSALALPHQLRGALEQSDPSFASLRLEIEWSGARGEAQAAHFDIDNDGREDSIEVAFDFVAQDDTRSEHWFWISGEGSRHEVPVLDRVHQGQTGLTSGGDNYAAFVFTPIRWRDQTLLYARLLPNSAVTEETLSAHFTRRASVFRQPLSRGLIQLAPDGGVRLVCGWTPHSRAEDRL